jgi:transposase
LIELTNQMRCKMSKYDKSFKEEAVRLALTTNQPIAKTAYDLDLKDSTLYAWVSRAKNKAPKIADENGNPANLIEELNRLRKENTRLKEEREILKKAAADSIGRCNKQSKSIKR